jgi:hypothetical protein
MSRGIFRTKLGLTFAGLVLLGVFAVRYTEPHRRVSTPLMKYDLRTPTGAPLASIFEGIAGPKLSAKVLGALLAERKAPTHHPCTKKTKTSLLNLFEIFFTPRSVFAFGCESPCTSHYNRTRNLYDPTCEDYVSVCDYGDIYEMGCEGAEFPCGDGSSLCGQYSCWNSE